jgi:glycosyltransferase involved in cell wall biosynthesis
MKKLLYVAPHLSTGGLPQYLTKKIELLKGEFEIYLIEWVNHTGGVFVVQRNKILSLVDPDKFFTLEENHQDTIVDLINIINPDIVHLEEIPEFFMPDDIALKIYSRDRKYLIVETSHDSSFDTNNKRFFPDKFMFVSEWQVQQYKGLDIPKVVVYYPIEYKERPNREEALRKLGLDPSKKHVLHVGLFTPRKNQAEFFEYAKALPEYEFHSVGNQADNFRNYWEPLMADKPSNLTWWNERSDVDNFYSAMDLFLFTSRGHERDKETMPLVIREAVSWQIPQLLYNLPVYLNYWDNFETIKYLEFDKFEDNCKRISQVLENKIEIKPEEEAFVISTYPNSDSVIETTKKCIEAAKSSGRKVILTSHIPIPVELSKLADYSINDNNNILTKHSYYCNYFNSNEQYDVHVNLRGNDNDVYHGPSCYSNYYNGAALANNLGIKKLYFLNYDYILYNVDFINEISKTLESKKAYLGKYKAAEGDTVYTYFLAINSDFYLKNIPQILSADDYENLWKKWGSESNGYENMMYHAFKDKVGIHYDYEFEQHVLDTFNHEDFSRVEYFTVLPTNKENTISTFIRISNAKENKTIKTYILDGDLEILVDTIEVHNKVDHYKLLPYIENQKIKFEIYDSNGLIDVKILSVDNLEQNGLLTIK